MFDIEVVRIIEEIKMDDIAKIFDKIGELAEAFPPMFPWMTKKDSRHQLGLLQSMETEIWDRAQEEYVQDPNIFANFNRVAKRMGMTPQEVLIIHATKHFDGIVAHVNGNKTQRDQLSGRIVDLRNYLAILDMMETAERAKQMGDQPEGVPL